MSFNARVLTRQPSAVPAAVILLLLAAPQNLVGQWVTPVGGAVHGVRALGESATLRVPVAVKEGLTLDSVRLEDVARDGFRPGELFTAVTVRLVTPEDAPAISFILDLAALEAQGRPDTLDVRVWLRARNSAAQDSTARESTAQDNTARNSAARDTTAQDSITSLDLRIHVPPGVVTAPGTIRMWRTDSGAETEAATPLTVRETSGNSRVGTVSVVSLPFVGEEDRPTNVRIVLDTSNAVTVPARGSATLPIRIEGAAPLGTVTGQIEVDAPQLAEPLRLDVEIRTRKSKWLLFLMILFGLVAGYVSRTWLQQQRELREAREEARRLLGRLDSILEKRRDPQLRKDVQRLIQDIEGVLPKGVAADIKTKLTGAETALADSLKRLQGRIDTEATEYKKLERLFAWKWKLPRAAEQVLTDARAVLDEMQRALAVDDAGSAKDLRERIHDALKSGLNTTFPSWKAVVTDELDRLDGPRHGLPKSVVERTARAVTAFRAELDAIKPPLPNDGLPQVEAAIQGVHAGLMGFRGSVSEMPVRALDVFAAVQRVFGSNPPDPGALEALEAHLKKVEAGVRGASELEDALRLLLGEESKAQWDHAILAQLPPGQNPDPVKLLLAKNDYEAAATAAAGRASAAKVTTAFPATEPGPQLHVPPAARVLTLSLQTTETPYVVPLLEARGFGELAKISTRVVQFLVFAAVIAAVGWLALADDFVGTYPDLITAFVWGFGLDVSAVTVVQKTAGVGG